MRARSGSLAAAVLVLALLFTSVGPPEPVPAEAQTDDRPSIVLIVTDDQRANTLGAMPILMERIGGAGIRFKKAFVPNALCCPARASILTGDHSHTTGVWNNGGIHGFAAFDESSTLATWLDDAGYRTGLFGKYINNWAEADPTYVPPGWDEWFAFMENCCSYYGFTASVNGTPTEFGQDVYGTTESARRAAEFITASAEPTFVLWMPPAPHQPATPESRFRGAFSDLEPWRPPSYMERDVSDKPLWVRRTRTWSAAERAEVDALRRRMYESLLSVDEGIDMVLDALEASGRISNTLIVFTSDNGVLWGEHRMERKPFPWNGTHRVPFFLRYDPLVASSGASTALTLTLDIAPTIVEVAGLEPRETDGKSLVPILRGERPAVRSRILIEHAAAGPAPPYCGIRSRRALFVRYATGEEEFYDYRKDPWELNNAANDPSRRQRIRTFRRFTREQCRPRPPGFTWRPS